MWFLHTSSRKRTQTASIIHCKRVITLWPIELLLGTKKNLLRHESPKPRSRHRVLFCSRCGCLTGAVSTIGKSISLCFFLASQVSLYDTCVRRLVHSPIVGKGEIGSGPEWEDDSNDNVDNVEEVDDIEMIGDGEELTTTNVKTRVAEEKGGDENIMHDTTMMKCERRGRGRRGWWPFLLLSPTFATNNYISVNTDDIWHFHIQIW